VDAGITEGDLVSDRYDPLLAKVIAHGSSRDAALDRMRTALADTAVLGVRTNLHFLRWLFAQPVLADGEMRTDTLARMVLPGPIKPPDDAWEAAADALTRESGLGGPWSDGWRLNAPRTIRVAHGADERSAHPRRTGHRVARHGETAYVDVDGQSLEFQLASAPTVDEAVRHAGQAEGSALLTAPMPGRVVAVRHGAGELVAAHDPVVVIEAMKMEHAVSAPLTGIVTAIHVRAGDQVQRGDLLAEVTAT